jgi:RND family efflux transporter MFP subunit
MSAGSTSATTAASIASAGKSVPGAAATEVLGEIERLATVDDVEEFLQTAVAVITNLTAARCGLLHQLTGPEEVRRTVQCEKADSGVESALFQEIDSIAAQSVAHGNADRRTLRADSGKFAVLCVPVQTEETGALAMTLVMGPERAPYLEPTWGMLQMMASVLHQHGVRGELQKVRTAFLQSTLLVDLFTRASDSRDFAEALTVVATELQEWLGCDRLAIGVGNASRLKVEAVSGFGKVEKRSHGNSQIMSMMKEALATESSVAWPMPVDESITVLAASDQTELLSKSSEGQVLSIPLIAGEDTPRGAWTMFWKERQGLNQRTFELVEAINPHLVSLVELLRKGLPTGPIGRSLSYLRKASKLRRAAIFALPIAIAIAMVIPVPYRIGAPAQLAPVKSRQVAAPFRGILEKTEVKPGDTVEKGKLLAMLDGKEIGWRLAEAVAKRDVAAKRRDQALSIDDVEGMQLAQHEFEALDAESRLLSYQQTNLEIVAPLSGLILSGDLEQSQGVPVDTGQKLFEIASLDQLRLEIAVSDEDVHWVEAGQKVTFRLESQPGEQFEAVIEEVYPISEMLDGENVFVCLTTVKNEDDTLRPGMRGRASVIGPSKPLGWVLFHKPWNFIRLRLF